MDAVQKPELGPADAEAILARYRLGRLVALTRLPVRAHNAPYYLVDTSTGRFFLKRYRDFTPNADRGLDLAVFLRQRGYPAGRVALTADGEPHVTHCGAVVALFEYLELPPPPEDAPLGPRRARALGAALGDLHALAVGFPPPLPPTFLGHGAFARRLAALRPPPWLPPDVRDLLVAAQDAFPELAARPDQPRGACHHELVREHVRFRGHHVAAVLDWDLVGEDHLFHDLGTTMAETVHAGGIDYRALGALLGGYAGRRALTDWEGAHLYEALRFGAFKYLTWSLADAFAEGPAIPAWARGDVMRAAAVCHLSRTEFDRALGRWFPPEPPSAGGAPERAPPAR